MKIINDIKLDFSDVLIRPKRSELSSRSEVQLERDITFKYSNYVWNGVPIICSNMDTVSTIDMYKKIKDFRMLMCFHKSIDCNDIIQNNCDPNHFMLSTGISDNDLSTLNFNINNLYQHGIDLKFICIDVANGYMSKLVDFCKQVREMYPNKIIIAGNVVTRELVEELIINGKVDIVKVGIGSGAVCTTRLQTGVGMPQFSSIVECADAAHGLGGHIISDGGICYPGDISKAFGAGGDFVMMGSMFAGHFECAGHLIEEDGKEYKMFYGMSSDTAMNKFKGGVAKYRSSEGKTVKVLCKGNIEHTIQNFLGGIRSTCTYVGAKRLKDLGKCCTFIRVNNQVNTFYK
jgi:GMP reductase